MLLYSNTLYSCIMHLTCFIGLGECEGPSQPLSRPERHGLCRFLGGWLVRQWKMGKEQRCCIRGTRHQLTGTAERFAGMYEGIS